MAEIEEQVYDIIFAGGGASACITAGRLAAADPDLKILIIEAGPHTRELQDHIQPARYFSNLALAKEVFSFHKGKPSKSLLGRAPIVPSGRALGGGSAVNFVVYTRAAASDYDDWETKFGNKGWSSEHIIPLLKKAETYQAESTNDSHGTSGPLKVSFAPDLKNVAEDFLQVAAAYDVQRSLTDDANEFRVVDKYAPWARYVDTETGRRSDTAHHYVYNQAHNSNLSVLDRHKVVRVIFEDRHAVGVQYVSDLVGRNGGVTTLLTARASRLVVLSSGAFGSPAILERSGIGGKSVLDKIGVEVLVDLPGVGEHYLDHYGIFLPFAATEDADTLDPIFHGSEEEIKLHAEQWLKEGKGLMSHNSVDSGIKFKPNKEERASMSPQFDHVWKTYYADVPDRPVLLLLPVVAYVGPDPTIRKGKYFTMAYFLGYPVSVGSVHITSGDNPYAQSDFHPGYLDEEADLVVLRWGYKKCRELARRMKLYAGDLVMARERGLNCGIKIRPADNELESMSPEFDRRWQTYYTSPNHQDKSVSLIGFMAAYGGATPDVPFEKYFTFVYFTAYPASVGSIHVTSGSDPNAPSEFQPGFLDDPADVATLRWTYKRARELARRMKYYAGDVVVAHPKYKDSSGAKVSELATPVAISDPDIVYSKEDDEAIDEHHRRRTETVWHSIGTCAMKPRERGGVVDARLNVYGVQGLKVADCSIAPGNVGANMYNTAIAIGEKAAVIIAQDLGIEGVTGE